MTEETLKTSKIRSLNDAFRVSGIGGQVYLTNGINSLPEELKIDLFGRIRKFNDFGPENDPYGEHDFGSLPVRDKKAYFKIDYYNENMSGGSEDPADPFVTTRVMTVMLSHEY